LIKTGAGEFRVDMRKYIERKEIRPGTFLKGQAYRFSKELPNADQNS
jgi:hypothetical protein